MAIHGFKKAVPLVTVLLAACSVTPVPLSDSEHQQRVTADIDNLYVGQEAVEAPVSLHEAIARAIKYNMDQRLKVMEASLANQMFAVSKLDMLPSVGFQGGYKGRNNDSITRSKNLTTGEQSVDASTSLDRERQVADLGITWNVLDFGVSYYRAQQQADRWLIAQERRRKVIHNIIQEVRSSYWRALSAEKVTKDLEPLMAKVEMALEQAREVERKRLKPPIESLTYQSRLLAILQQLHEIRQNVMAAKNQLSSLMNLPAGTEYVLVDEMMEDIPEIDISVKELEQQALVLRPELREEGYNHRISSFEVKKTMASLMPSLQFGTSYNYDSNSYNQNSNWVEFSALITGDLMDLFTLSGRLDLANAQGEVVEVRRMALSMAVMTQVHISLMQFQQSVNAFETASDIDEVEHKLFQHMKASTSTNISNEQDLIESELKAILARLKKGDSYANLQRSYGNVYLSVGIDPISQFVSDETLDALTEALREGENNWRNWQPVPLMPVEAEQDEVSEDTSESASDSDEIMLDEDVSESASDDEPMPLVEDDSEASIESAISEELVTGAAEDAVVENAVAENAVAEERSPSFLERLMFWRNSGDTAEIVAENLDEVDAAEAAVEEVYTPAEEPETGASFESLPSEDAMETTAEDAIAEEAMPEEAMPEEAMPEESMPEESMPEEAREAKASPSFLERLMFWRNTETDTLEVIAENLDETEAAAEMIVE